MRLALLGLAGLVALGVVVAAGGALYLHVKHAHDQKVAEQRKVQENLTGKNKLGDLAQLKADSSNLIQGDANGTYNLSNKDLAQAYVNKGDTELSAHNYKGALADYQKAAQLYPADQDLVNYGEFISRYNLGERKTLIPLLQDMAKPLKDNKDPQMQSQLVLYDQYISDLQAGKDLRL